MREKEVNPFTASGENGDVEAVVMGGRRFPKHEGLHASFLVYSAPSDKMATPTSALYTSRWLKWTCHHVYINLLPPKCHTHAWHCAADVYVLSACSLRTPGTETKVLTISPRQDQLPNI